MTSTPLSRILIRLAILLTTMSVASFAASIHFDTTSTYADDWWVTQPNMNAGGFMGTTTQGQAFSVAGGTLIAPSSNAKSDGASLTDRSVAGTLANFGGVWYADYTFYLPSNAYDISLSFANLAADDRVIMKLNNHPIGNETIDGGTGTGKVTNETGTTLAWSYDQTTSGIVTNASYFTLGGINMIRLLVNNTGGTGSKTLPTSYFNPLGTDATAVMVAGNVTYSLNGDPAPEPGTLSLLLLGLVPLGYRLRRRA